MASEESVILLRDNEQEVLQIGAALDVEQLDTYLFRSKELHKPFRARGAFGGQVISQALVSATRCVKPEYLVHVRRYLRSKLSTSDRSACLCSSHYM